jgi:predicted DNA-binding ribbon-helix-helix protein
MSRRYRVQDSRLVNRNVVASHGRTSMRLEPELWSALDEICRREGLTLAALVQHIERDAHPGGRTSAVRVYALRYFRAAATEQGHRDAGHGAQPLPESAAAICTETGPDPAASTEPGSAGPV